MANVDLTLHAEMATDYFQLRGLDSEIKLLNVTVADLQKQLDLTQRRFNGGVGTGVDVAQARPNLRQCARNWWIWAWLARSMSTPLARSPITNSPSSAFRRRRWFFS